MAKVEQHIFREYDIRGIVGKDLTENSAELIGKAYGTMIQPISGNKIVVGADNRPSSIPLKKALIRGLIQTGCNVTDIGMCTTPMLYFAVCNYTFDGGISVTGSHNPPEYNGFKLTSKKAEPIYGMMIQDMQELASKSYFKRGKGSVNNYSILNEYLKMLTQKTGYVKKLNVVVDCGNGAASIVAQRFFESIGCIVTPLYCTPDGAFPNHLPDPTRKEFMTDLIEKVKSENADLGIGFDGDADRLGVVDDKGNLLFGDQLLVLFVRDILEKNPKSKILFEVKCSQALYDEIERLGGKPIFWKTGHSLIKAKMKQEKAIFAGEMSGHMFFADDFYGYDDAIYAAARLLMLLSKTDKKLSELIETIPKYYASPEYRVDCADSLKFKVVESLTEHFIKLYPNSIIVDGIRVQFKDGWGLIRASNTQPKLILRFESKSKEGLKRIKKTIAEKLSEFGGIDLGELEREVS